MDLLALSQEFGCRELRIEKRAVFQIALPTGELIGVKTKTNRLVSEVVYPILEHFGYRVEHIKMFTITNNNNNGGHQQQQQQLLPDQPIIQLDGVGQCVRIVYSEDLEEYGWDTTRTRVPVALKQTGEAASATSGEQRIKAKQSDGRVNFGEFSCEMITDVNRNFYTNGNRSLKPDFVEQISLSPSPTAIVAANESALSANVEGEDTLSDAFFAEIVRNNQQVPSPIVQPFAGDVNTANSVAYGCIGAAPGQQQQQQQTTSILRANSMSTSKPVFEKCSPRNRSNLVTNEIDLDATMASLGEVGVARASSTRGHALRNLQNHRNFQTHHAGVSPEPLSRVSPTPAAAAAMSTNKHENAENIAPAPSSYADPAPPLPPRNAAPASLLLHSTSAPVPPPRVPIMSNSISCPMALPGSNSMTASTSSRHQHQHHHHRSRVPITTTTTVAPQPDPLANPLAHHTHHHHHPLHPLHHHFHSNYFAEPQSNDSSTPH